MQDVRLQLEAGIVPTGPGEENLCLNLNFWW
jgi:hypothetical protein